MYKIKTHALLLVLLSFALIGCDPKTPAPETAATDTSVESESDRLNAWLEERYEEELMNSPITLTFLGRKELNDKIDDVSEAAEDEQLAWKLDSVATMKSTFDYQALSDTAKLSYDLWAYQAREAESAHKWRRHQYMFHQMDTLHAFLPTFLMSFHVVENKDDLAAYVSRISESGRAINQITERAKLAAEDGIRAPRFAYEIVSQQAQDLITGAPFSDDGEADSPIWADFNGKAATLVEDASMTQDEADALMESAKQALLNDFGPAYTGVIDFLAGDIANTSEEAQGVHALPDGENAYKAMLWSNTTTDLTADEIHQIGLDEVARIRAEMEVLKEKSGFEGDLLAFFNFLRDSKDNEKFYFPNTDEGRQGYIDEATADIANIKTQLGDFFGILPKADLVVKRVEPFREQDGAPQHYFSGTPDGSRPGIYYAHLSDMSAMPKRELEVIAYHEGLPGHHMQISIAQELDGVPEFRKQAGYNVYAEGWALYSEKLATEMPGTFQDVYSDFGRLGSEIWRAIRLVVDTGLHHKGWSQQDAVDFFSANAAAPLPQVEAEVRRYLVIPGQATGYKIGMIDIQRMRKVAEEALGDNFDIRTFHDAILDGGALPMEMLDRKITQYIQDSKTAAAAAAE
jgi:uncharacterized protein (DUF885 family)